MRYSLRQGMRENCPNSQSRCHAKGSKVGMLSIDAISERRSLAHYNQPENHPIDKAYFVNSMVEWESAFKQLQGEVDMLFLENPEGIVNWDMERASAFVKQNTIQ